ncbi:MAG: tetratricopeptide repeat protein [Zoogloeaceae bacterium]|jgi:tetratricopeptide (TPR) repeat protein|nr:tetratricopeptide repeat protein [Zoogloeaceae bacterium]
MRHTLRITPVLLALLLPSGVLFIQGCASKRGAEALHAQGCCADEIEYYSKTIEEARNKTGQEARDDTLWMVHYNRAIAYMQAGKYAKAIADFTTTIKLHPYDKDAHVNRGIAYHNLNDYDKAMEDYAKAIELDPDYAADAYFNRARIHYRLDDYHSALVDYDQAIKMNPNLAVAYHNRALVHATLENHEAAEKDARKACELGECGALETLKKQVDK